MPEPMTPPPNPPPAGPDTGHVARLFEEAAREAGGGSGRAPPPTPEELAPLFPDLEIHEVIGAGGMGVVYRARHRRLERLVALKVLPRDLAKDPQFAERFIREAKTLARLDHPRIVRVHDFGEAGGLYFLVLEHVDGANLRQVMAAGRLTPAEALAIVPQICEALQYAHDQGVVHRDIKPENVLLDSRGHVKITDFGLAKIVGKAPDSLTLTNAGQVMGTYQYMAPEQMRTPQEVDHRADLYSLGVVFYEMLTGELPMGRFEPPSQSADLDARIDRIVMHALERQRERRYQKAEEIRTDVHGLSRSPTGRPPAASRAPSTQSGRRALFAAAIAVPLGVAVVGLVHEAWGGVIRGTPDAAAREIWKGVAGGAVWLGGAVAGVVAALWGATFRGGRGGPALGVALTVANAAAIVVTGAVLGNEVFRHTRTQQETVEVANVWRNFVDLLQTRGMTYEAAAEAYTRPDRERLLAVPPEDRKPVGGRTDRSRGIGVYFTGPLADNPFEYRVVGTLRTPGGLEVEVRNPSSGWGLRFPMAFDDGAWRFAIGPVVVVRPDR